MTRVRMRGGAARAAWFLGLLLWGWMSPGEALAAAPADTLAAVWTREPATARVGERVRVRLAVAVGRPGDRLVGPPPGPAGAIDVVTSGESAAGPDSAAWELEIACFEPGEERLDRLAFRLEGEGGMRPVVLRQCAVQVEATLPDSAGADDLADIRGPVPVSLRWIWSRIVIAVLLVAAAVGAWIFWRSRQRPAAAILPAEPRRSPDEIALGALRRLEEEALPARGRRKEHYVRLSEILRRYVEDRFGLPAVESTTLEIRGTLERSAAPPVAEPASLLAILEESDLVKFARFDPGLEAARETIPRARTWVSRNAALAPEEGEADHAIR